MSLLRPPALRAAALALLLALVSASLASAPAVASAAPTQQRAGLVPGPCATGPAPFSDVPTSHPFCGEITWAVAEGITGGYSDGSFRPGLGLSRQAAAAFLVRGLPPIATPACDAPPGPFSDVAHTSTFCTEIAQAEIQGIVTGFPGGTFAPVAPVSRQALAAFLYRLSPGRAPGGPCVAPITSAFPDVPIGNPFCTEIATLAGEGIIGGFGDGTFRPSATVTRQAIVAFVSRVLTVVPDIDALKINEVDYRGFGGEFIELRNTGTEAVPLSRFHLDLVDGAGGTVYRTIHLPIESLAPGGHFVVCAQIVDTSVCDLDIDVDDDLIQSGPDAIALRLDDQRADALGYGGNVAGYSEGTSVTVNDELDPADRSVGRCPDGADTDDNDADFRMQTPTPGEPNGCELVDEVLRINEIDYDNAGPDTAEYIELVNTGTYAISLGDVSLDLANGNNPIAPEVYATIALPGVYLPGGGHFVICGNGATVPACDHTVAPSENLLENGGNDAVGLYLQGRVFSPREIDALSYEGDLAGFTEGEGTAGLIDSGAGSIGRCPDGHDTDSNIDDFVAQTSTPGTPNTCPVPEGALKINEIDYDQAAADTAEFIEVINTDGGPIGLGGVTIELVNQSSAVYQTIVLPAVALTAGGHYVICGDDAAVANCDLDIDATSWLQNGPDAIGLRSGGALVDAVSYEGEVPGYTEGTGIVLGDGNTAGVGLSRCPEGADTDENDDDFSLLPITPGATNAC